MNNAIYHKIDQQKAKTPNILLTITTVTLRQNIHYSAKNTMLCIIHLSNHDEHIMSKIEQPTCVWFHTIIGLDDQSVTKIEAKT